MTAAPRLDGPLVLPASGAAPKAMVIFLHGYGSNGEDLISLAPYWQSALPQVAFIAPNAPQPCPGSPSGYQWWGLASFTPESRIAGVRQAAPVLDAFIDDMLARYGLTEDRLALVGFSQGTMMALQVGLRRKRQLAGIVGYSGMLAAAPDPATETFTKPPVLLVHGDADPVIPATALPQAQAALQAVGVEVATHVSRGLGHSIDQAGLQLGGEFLQRVLPTA